jgi:glycosyltransferase involved in cell wall biosynthesis
LKVSVIIPTYNRCEFVQQAIDSVLAQNYKDYEIIVVDDGSTDGTGEVLRARYGATITYVWQENQGESVARNRGIAMGNGRYIAFLDSDDIWLPTKLSQQVPVLENDLDLAAVFCQAWIIDDSSMVVGNQPLGKNTKLSDLRLERLMIRNWIPAGASTCLVRRSILAQIGGFAKDWELWLNLAALNRIFFLSEPLASYRRHQRTQSFFTSIEVVDRKLEDHTSLLERTCLRFPDSVSKDLCHEAIAFQYLIAGLASYLLNSSEKGRQRLARAIELDPAHWTNEKYLLSHILIFAASYAVDSESVSSSEAYSRFIDNLCANLPERLASERLVRVIRGNAKVQLGFLDYHKGNRCDAVRQLLQGISFAPGAMNLAVLAILAEPILGKRVVDHLRMIAHP